MANQSIGRTRDPRTETLMGFSLRFRERLDEGTADEIDKLQKFLKQFLLREHNEDGTHIVESPTTNVAAADAPYVTVGNTSALTKERALTGTANQVTVTDNGENSTVQLGTPQDIGTGSSPTFAGTTLSGLTATRLVASSAAKALSSVANLTSWIAGTANQVTVTDDGDGTITLSTPQDLATTSSPTFTTLSVGGAAAAATSCRHLTKKVTGIADNTATDVLTVTIPNANHAAAIKIMFLSSNGSTDAFESSRVATGHVVVARTTGANAVATAAALDNAAIATVSGGATHTLAYGVSAITGAVGDPNTFTIQVTLDDSGNLGSNQVVCSVELLNAESTGITIA